jgi:hypothetical protein
MGVGIDETDEGFAAVSAGADEGDSCGFIVCCFADGGVGVCCGGVCGLACGRVIATGGGVSADTSGGVSTDLFDGGFAEEAGGNRGHASGCSKGRRTRRIGDSGLVALAESFNEFGNLFGILNAIPKQVLPPTQHRPLRPSKIPSRLIRPLITLPHQRIIPLPNRRPNILRNIIQPPLLCGQKLFQPRDARVGRHHGKHIHGFVGVGFDLPVAEGAEGLGDADLAGFDVFVAFCEDCAEGVGGDGVDVGPLGETVSATD